MITEVTMPRRQQALTSVCVCGRSSLRDFSHHFHFTQRWSAGL